ncbi:hypothetical protein PUN28_003105 [Cardiocondyla obscurior]|uniref:Uncharacterized protein n=1 Tax=Cardiocondyla obscurior TaxID=286306 RepID=A0AAW2GH62_9HYME
MKRHDIRNSSSHRGFFLSEIIFWRIKRHMKLPRIFGSTEFAFSSVQSIVHLVSRKWSSHRNTYYDWSTDYRISIHTKKISGNT